MIFHRSKTYYLSKIIAVISLANSKISKDSDVSWAGYNSSLELQNELESDLEKLKSGNLEMLEVFHAHFLPTCTYQEVALSNGWADEYLTIAEEFDGYYTKMNRKAST
jgi:hypothetical protein